MSVIPHRFVTNLSVHLAINWIRFTTSLKLDIISLFDLTTLGLVSLQFIDWKGNTWSRRRLRRLYAVQLLEIFWIRRVWQPAFIIIRSCLWQQQLWHHLSQIYTRFWRWIAGQKLVTTVLLVSNSRLIMFLALWLEQWRGGWTRIYRSALQSTRIYCRISNTATTSFWWVMF